jgi:hypothetical protein
MSPGGLGTAGLFPQLAPLLLPGCLALGRGGGKGSQDLDELGMFQDCQRARPWALSSDVLLSLQH